MMNHHNDKDDDGAAAMATRNPTLKRYPFAPICSNRNRPTPITSDSTPEASGWFHYRCRCRSLKPREGDRPRIDTPKWRAAVGGSGSRRLVRRGFSVGGTLKIPTTTSSSSESSVKKRKRPSTSEFYDVSVSSGLPPVVMSPVPEGLVPIWSVGNPPGMMIPSNAVAAGGFWMMPQPPAMPAAASSQPQLWTISPSVTPVFNMDRGPVLADVIAPS